MSSIKVIGDANALSKACDATESASWLSLDTEFMREKTYAPLLCLVQVCTLDEIYCIDALAIDDLAPLINRLEDPAIEMIWHSCRQDFEALDCRHSMTPTNLFDTQIAAAFCGFGDQVSYAAMVEAIQGTKLAKSHTRANWQARPLSNDELEYALDDVRYLSDIRNHLGNLLDEQGRREWFDEECLRQCQPETWRIDPETAWVRLKGAARLPIEAQQAARYLAVWRERQAIARNRPREWIISSSTLLEISRTNPANISQLEKIEGVHPGFVRHSGEIVLDILNSTPRISDIEPVWTNLSALGPLQRKQVKGVMNMIRTAAENIGISPSLIANRNMVESFVRGKLDLALFVGWRFDLVGEHILADYS